MQSSRSFAFSGLYEGEWQPQNKLLISSRRVDSTEQEESMSEQEVFLNTVYNMKPEEVFNRGLPRSARHLKPFEHGSGSLL